MKSLVIFFLFILFCVSCQRNTIVYYNNTEDYDDAEIWGTTDLYLFFKDELGVNNYRLTSRRYYRELYKIKNELINKGTDVYWDNNFYEYAFILNEEDTLYANLSQSMEI